MKSCPIACEVTTMRVGPIVGVLVLSLAVWNRPVQAHPAQAKPIVSEPIYGDYFAPPPASLDALLSMSPVVVEATILETRPADRVQVSEGKTAILVFTIFTLGSLDWIKPSSGQMSAQSLELRLPGGVRDRGAKIVSTVDRRFPAPKVGERYLLFLRPDRGFYVPAANGPESAFKIRDETIVPIGRSPLSRSLDGQSRTAVAASLRGPHRGRVRKGAR
jgi:hypothetical protein